MKEFNAEAIKELLRSIVGLNASSIQRNLEFLYKSLDNTPVSLLMKKKDQYVFANWVGIEKKAIKSLEKTFNKALPLHLKQVFREKKPLVIENTLKYPGWVHQRDVDGFFWCGVPVFQKNKVVGIINIGPRDRIITQSEIDFTLSASEAVSKIIEIGYSESNAARYNRYLKLLLNISSNLIKHLSCEEVFDIYMDFIEKKLNKPYASMLILDDKKENLIVKRISKGYRKEAQNLKIPITKEKGITAYAILTKKVINLPDVTKDKRYIIGLKGAKSELAIPLVIRGEALGVLNFENRVKNGFSKQEEKLLKPLANILALAIDAASKATLVKEQAIKDQLTGLFNRRFFDIKLEEEINRLKRYNQQFSLIMFDIDHFKQINDQYGHLKGDWVLIKVGEIILTSIRKSDFGFRYGGDEFTIIVHNADAEKAKIVALRILNKMKKIVIDEKELSASFGIVFASIEDTYETLVAKTDKRMYEAKKGSLEKIVNH